jgi:hypothetical protein
MDQAGSESQHLSTKPSGVWGARLQGGGAVSISRYRGGRRGAPATDDNAAGGPPSGGVRARPRDAGKIHQTPPAATKETPSHV